MINFSNKPIFVNINGAITKAEDAKISVFDRGFLYGDSIYETTYTQERSLVFFKEHLARLTNSANLINMHISYSLDEIAKEAMRTLTHANIARAYLRIIMTRGNSEVNLDPSDVTENNMVIIVKEQPEYPQAMYNNGLKLMIANTIRNDRKATNPNAKSGNYLNSVMALGEAKKEGFQDAIMLNAQGNVTEGTTFNIWCVKDGTVYTAPESSGLLKGITRDKVIEVCRENNIPLKIENYNADFILSADEVFITNSTKGVMAVSQLDDSQFLKERILIKKISDLYKSVVEKEILETEFKF